MTVADTAVSDLVVASQQLAFGAEDPVALQRLGRKIAGAVAHGQFASRLTNVAILSSFLLDMLRDALAASLLARGLAAKISTAPYGVIAADLLSDDSVIVGCDVVLILPTYRDLLHRPAPRCTPEEAEQAAKHEAHRWLNLWRQIGDKPIVQLSFGPPAYPPLGDADGLRPGGLLRFIRDVNRNLADTSPNQVALVDAEALAARTGPSWNDSRTYFLCKQPFAISAMSEVANTLASATSGLLGKARKCLVLDLDNTIWGGIIGDVGVEGIIVGIETSEGESFAAVQTYARNLAARGVILAVCSKNAEAIAREPFRNHSGMILREEDIACFVANFDDKATNLRRIAQELNIGLDAIVFVDDNPVERAWVRRELPEVLVIDLPDDPALYCAAIENAKAFPSQRLTAEDLNRNRSYRNRASITLSSPGNVTEFLESLAPVITVETVGPGSLDRIVQLIAKTNQFKLNPQTFTADEIVSHGTGVLALRFRDRLQDYGIVAVVVTRIEKHELWILNWVMSCRVFSRRLEHSTLELLRKMACTHGATTLRATFRLSAKNNVAREALVQMGFVLDPLGDYLFPSSQPAAGDQTQFRTAQFKSIEEQP